MDDGPEREASAKLAQHLAVAAQVAEAVIRMRQHQAERQAAGTEQAAAAARAERTAQHAADRMVWTPALDSTWTSQADLPDLGRAWAAAAGWADTDPVANVAATRVEARLSDLAPTAMAHFDELRQTGTSRLEAMREVLARLTTESSSRGPRVFVAEPGQPAAATTPASAGTRADQARQFPWSPDDPARPRVDERAEGVGAAAPRRAEQGEWQHGAVDRFAVRRTTDAGNPHAADVAAYSYPRPYAKVTPTKAGKAAPTPVTATRSKTRTLSR